MRIRKKTAAFVLSVLLVFSTAAVGGMGVTSFASEDIVDAAACFVPAEVMQAVDAQVTVKAINCESEMTIGYKETRNFEFETEYMPKDADVHVFRNGEDMGVCSYISIYSPTEDYTVEAKVLDRDGNVLASSGEIRVKVKNGFFDRFDYSVKKGFRTFGDAVMDIFGAIFMRIWIFLHK